MRGILAVTFVAAMLALAMATAPSTVSATLSPQGATAPTMLTYSGTLPTSQGPAKVTQLLVHVVGGSGASLVTTELDVTTWVWA